MTQHLPPLLSVDGPPDWRSLQTEASAGWTGWIFIIPAFLTVTCGGGFMVYLGLGTRDLLPSRLLLGTGAFLIAVAIWTALWISQHGTFNFDINQKTRRIRKWKTSLFLERSFDEYSFDDFRAVRSVRQFGDDIHWVVVELLFKTVKPALEVGQFKSVVAGTSRWQKCVSTWRGLHTEGPESAALRSALVRLMGIPDKGYFDKQQ